MIKVTRIEPETYHFRNIRYEDVRTKYNNETTSPFTKISSSVAPILTLNKEVFILSLIWWLIYLPVGAVGSKIIYDM